MNTISHDPIADLLSLVINWPERIDFDVREVVAGWTDDARSEAEAWAGALYVRASDHDDVRVPPEPNHVFELRCRVTEASGDNLEHVTPMPEMPARRLSAA